MIKGLISWADYFKVVLMVLLIYYIYVFFRFYFADFKLKMNSTKSKDDFSLYGAETKGVETITLFENELEAKKVDEEQSDSVIVDQLLNQILILIENSGDVDSFKSKLSNLLSISQLKHSEMRPVLNELIVSEIDKSTLVHHIDVSEVDRLWDSVV